MIIKPQLILDDIKRIYKLLKKLPTSRDYQTIGNYHLTTVFNKFGSWNKAKALALNIEVKPYSIPKQKIIKDLILVKEKLNRIPSKSEYHKFGTYTEQAIVPKFGSWNKALMFIFGKTYQQLHEPQTVSCEHCSKLCKKTPCQLKANSHHFCSLSCSSKYHQKNKKSGVRVSKMEKYLRKKLEDIYPYLRINFNDTKTIGLELDFYIPSMSLAFEINGIFHYKSIFGEKKLTKTKNTDNRKKKLCRKAHIKLIVVNTSKVNVFNEEDGNKFLKKLRFHIDSHALSSDKSIANMKL